MDCSVVFHFPLLPVELWKEVLDHCPPNDLARVSTVNSQFLEFSRDSLYSKLFIWSSDRLRGILYAMRTPDVARRLRYIVFDPTGTYADNSDLEVFLETLISSPLDHLDIVSISRTSYIEDRWMLRFIFRIIHLPQLQSLKLALIFLSEPSFATAFQVRALQDLDASDTRLPSLPRPKPSTILGRHIPRLDTLRIRKSAVHWRKLLGYVDLSRMRRLALWDYENAMGDLKNEWGGLVIASAPTLKSLSLWLTPKILGQDIPNYLQSSPGFPALRTLSLFIDIQSLSHWTSIFLSIMVAFHTFAPLLRHIRLYVHAWTEEYSYEALLNNELFMEFAREVKGLRNLETINLSFRHAYKLSYQASDSEQALLAKAFHPVQLAIESGVTWNDAWPFFEGNHPNNLPRPL
ncbi:hypothetical protein DL96DRAFT_1711699 [Flagelloscypha sp. PMI_526]|nr:hypothetical protein DL96DRAFT_1711699 [Flagelloscypha sp. PMI_526]